MAISKPQRVTLQPSLNILLYGSPGVGKTTLACSAQDHPDLSPVLVANFEGGLLSVASRGDIDYVDIKSIQDMDDLFWKIRNKDADFGHYKTIVIDSGSEMQTLALEETVRDELKKRKDKTGTTGDRTIDDIEIQTYGTVSAKVSRLMRWYRDLPINTIITALPKFTYAQGADQRTAAPREVSPAFTAKLGVSIMGYADMVWFLGDKGGHKILLTQDNGIYRAKTRGFNFSKALGPQYSDPWLPEIYELLKSSESGTDRATQVTERVELDSIDIFAPPPTVEVSSEPDATQPEEVVIPTETS